MDNMNKLLMVLQSYAPDASAQQTCSRIVHELQRCGESDREIDLTLAGCLVDGLRHGNWPWIV
jgi:hypothetical protein